MVKRISYNINICQRYSPTKLGRELADTLYLGDMTSAATPRPHHAALSVRRPMMPTNSATATTTEQHPSDRPTVAAVATAATPLLSSWLSRHFLLLRLVPPPLPPPSLLFHPCIGFGLHRAAATHDSAGTVGTNRVFNRLQNGVLKAIELSNSISSTFLLERSDRKTACSCV